EAIERSRKRPWLDVLVKVVRGQELVALVDALQPVFVEVGRVPQLQEQLAALKQEEEEAKDARKSVKDRIKAVQEEITKLTEPQEEEEEPQEEETFEVRVVATIQWEAGWEASDLQDAMAKDMRFAVEDQEGDLVYLDNVDIEVMAVE